MNGLSLCSGIGGLDLGLQVALPGYRTICNVEVEPACQDLLLARMAAGVLDRAPIWGDLKHFDGRGWRGLVDLVHGGYPCQPFSFAGKRRGAEDPRHLWPDVARIVEAVEPTWCLFENVAGHLSLGASEVVRALVAMGYRVALGLFTASELGAPHRRERLFLLAHRDVLGASVGAGVAGRVAPICFSVDYPRRWPPPRRDPAWRDVLVLDPSLSPTVDDGGRRHRNPAFVEWLMGFPRGWTEGRPKNTRQRMLGNAVIPAMAQLAWHELSAAFSGQRGQASADHRPVAIH